MKKIQIVLIAMLIGISGLTVQAQQKPLKVYVLVGQSNMQGHAHVRTLPHIGMDAETETLLNEIQDKSGQPRVIDGVWISYLSSKGVKSGALTTGFGADENKIGPELTFGIYMQKRVGEPILIIKAAWGGKSINTDFRPPSAGPYRFDASVLNRLKEQGKDIESIQAEKAAATGVYYRQTVAHVKQVLKDIKSVYPDYDSKQGYQLAGMVWFQGWNDMVDGGTYPQRGDPGGYDDYSQVLAHLIRDFRTDLGVQDLPFVIGVMGVNGPTDQYTPQQQRYKNIHQGFRDAMAAPADFREFTGNVVAVLTEECWDQELDSILVRDTAIKNKVKRFKKDGNLKALVQELKDGKETSELDVQSLEGIQNERQLEQALLEHFRSVEFSKRESQVLQLGVSNAAFHYLGCSKIMAQIGKSFAESMPLKIDDAKAEQ